MAPFRQAAVFALPTAGLLALSILLQVVGARYRPGAGPAGNEYLYVSSGEVMKRVALSYDALAADVFWIRAIQHYGGTKRSAGADKSYALLYPLLDLTTSLDPRFAIAYRFGAIFLTEAYPNGPGQPELAIALLEKGIAAQPEKWQYRQDIGFIHYWWLHDYKAASEWFLRASEVEAAPWWLKSLAAVTLAQGGDRHSSRLMWQQLRETADNEWLRNEAARRLLQLTALDEIDRLTGAVNDYAARFGAPPPSWEALRSAGYLVAVPADPTGHPYVLDARTRQVTVAADSPLFPLPTKPSRLTPPVS